PRRVGIAVESVRRIRAIRGTLEPSDSLRSQNIPSQSVPRWAANNCLDWNDIESSVRPGGLGRADQAEELGAPWPQALARGAKRRLHHNVLAIALANKLARIAWSVLAHGRNFESRKMPATAQ